MSQAKLIARIALEQPRINAALGQIVASMPSPAQPVANHILQAGGKRLRPLLTVLAARLFGYKDDDIYVLAACIELFHAATLLHDDVLDHADMRRGKPAAHMVFGTHTAILGADAMLACSARIVASYGDPRLVNCLAQILEQTVSGQISEMDSLWRISEDVGEYLQIIRSKTAWTIRGSCELGALRAGAQGAELEAIMEYGLAVGMAFQIIDDALDFAPSEKTGKPEGGDLREGKATPPLLLYLDSLPGEERAHISALFTQRLLQREEADNIARNIRKHGFDAATRTMADAYLEKAEQALKILSGLVQEQEYALLSQAISYVRNRES